jgi:hypothetical protein
LSAPPAAPIPADDNTPTVLSASTNTYASCSSAHSPPSPPQPLKLAVPRANPGNPYLNPLPGSKPSAVIEQEAELVSALPEREQSRREERVEIEEEHEPVDVVMHDVSKKREGDNAESAAPAKKKQRRERSERTSWGLTVVRFLLLL